jgi:hypothetical protein
MIINVYRSSCKVAVMFVRFKLNLNVPDKFSKNVQIPYFMNVRPVEAEFFRADGQTDIRT